MTCSRLLPLLRSFALLLVFGLAGTNAIAATVTIGIALDTDNNAATGCTISTANGSVAGIEMVGAAIISTSVNGATVARLERQSCAGGALGAPSTYDNGGWNVGFGNGTSGRAVVEASIPRHL